jgi:CP family cyanate transporter-like MFS transporter
MTTPARSTLATRHRPALALAVLGVLFVGLTLRPAITAIAPVLADIKVSEGLNSAAAGMLTTVPLLCFVAFSTLAPKFGARLGYSRTILAALVLLIVGFLVRYIPGLVTLYVGTAIIGIAITFGNVLIPAYIKQRYAGKTGVLTGVYTISLYLGPALAAGLTFPLRDAFGHNWRAAVTFWGSLVVIGIISWLPHLRSSSLSASVQGSGRDSTSRTVSLWKQPLAWAVTGYFAILSVLFYTISAWLPTILVDHGLKPVESSGMLSLVNIAAIPCALAVSIIVFRTRRQVWATTTGSTLLGVGLIGLLLSPTHDTAVWVVIFGLGHGTATGIAYSLPLLRARDARGTAELGGMSQTAGYALSAIGPVGAGVLHDLTGGWTVLIAVLIVLVAAQLISGLVAGRPDVVNADPANQHV